MITLKKIFSVAIIAALTLVACSPEDGETGPAGPIGPEGQIGPAGDDGRDGLDGVDGVDGKDGVANIETYTFFVDSATWNGPNGSSINNSINVPQITAEIVERGTIQVFQTSDNTNPQSTSWRAVPYTNAVFSYSYSYNVGIIDLILTVTVNGSAPTLAAARDHTYKVVIIPPAALLEGVDYDDYQAVKMIYGLED